MCGICGIYSPNKTIITEKDLKRMCNVMFHRGPDDDGYYIDPNVGLGMRRLSVIDLVTGKQPIHNEDQSIWIVFNGEIYNFRELREDLMKNYSFYTNSDTETIMHLYEQYGEECVHRLNGMFAFAIWDARKKKLFIARDRLGIKPLYYIQLNGKLIFASAINSILQLDFVPRKVDVRALDCYLSFLYTPAPFTMFEDIKKLPAGHVLSIQKGKATVKKYWEVTYRVEGKKDLNYFVNGFMEKFRQSVKRRLISDVPLGAFLSGGIDSSAVVAIMSEISERPVETFTIGYGKPEQYYDERPYARLISERFGTIHHEFEVHPEIISIMPNIIKSLDEPLADSSTIPNYYISKMVANYVTVALSGMGGDELAAGYERYVGMHLSDYYRKIPRFLRERIISNIALRLPDSKKGRHFTNRVKRFVKYGDLPTNMAYFGFISAFDRETKKHLLNPAIYRLTGNNLPEELFNSYYFHHKLEDTLSKCLFVDLKTYLVDDLLALTDKMSMAHSLEVRVPFLDHELVEFLATVPPDMKLKGINKKYLLKKAFASILPKEVLYKTKKGFSVPAVLWLRKDLRGFVSKIFSKEKIETQGYFNWDYIQTILNAHFRGQENYSSQIWALLTFTLWYDCYIDRTDSYDD